MNNKIVRIGILIVFVLMLGACKAKPKDTILPTPESPFEENDQNEMIDEEAHTDPSKENDIELVKMTYTHNEIQAHYPQLSAGLEEQKRETVNQIIQNDLQAIVDIYSADIAPDNGTSSSEAYEFILTIDYEIKLQNYDYLSIYYSALYNSVTAAYPSEMVYTTNIDLVNQTRLRLSDIVNLSESFVADMKTWDLITIEEDNKELEEAVNEYLQGISNAELLKGLKAADQIGIANNYGIYSYLTKDALGITISVPHVMGDYVRLERKYKKLKDYLKIEME